MKVMHETEQQKPHLHWLGDQLGAWYKPISLGVASTAALLSGPPERNALKFECGIHGIRVHRRKRIVKTRKK